jgi:carbamoyl-phosphate synthase large subunit
MYQFLTENGFGCARTYGSFPEFLQGYEAREIDFPVFVKPRISFGSQGTMRCDDMDKLRKVSAVRSDLIIQEFLDGAEIGLDVYIDTISRKMVSVFAKQKYAIMNGTADRALTLKDPELFALVEKLSQRLGAIGPLNVEMFKMAGGYRVGEVNPRFGGSYYCAYDCGVNFCPLILNNIRGIENPVDLGGFPEDVLLLKYDKIIIKSPAEMLS